MPLIPVIPTSFKILFLLVLSACTIIFFNYYERYHIVGPELLENADFRDGLQHWERSGLGIALPAGGAGVAKLHVQSPIKHASLYQVVQAPYHFKLLCLSADIKTLNVVSGDKSWETARVVLVSHNRAGEAMYFLPHILTQQRGNADWAHYEKVFSIAPTVAKVYVIAQILQSTGTLWIKSISLRPVALKSAFKQYRQALLFIWAVMVLWIGIPLLKSGFTSLKHGTALMLATAIILGVLMPENLKESLSATFVPFATTDIASFIPTHFNDTQSFKFTPVLPTLDIYKTGHFIMFTLLAITLFGAKPYSASNARLFVYLVLFALVTEVLQLFMAGRTAQFGDILIDSIGIATGFAIAWIWRYFSSINQHNVNIKPPPGNPSH